MKTRALADAWGAMLQFAEGQNMYVRVGKVCNFVRIPDTQRCESNLTGACFAEA